MNRFIKYNFALVAFSFMLFRPAGALQGDLPPVPALTPTPDDSISAPVNPSLQPNRPRSPPLSLMSPRRWRPRLRRPRKTLPRQRIQPRRR